MRKLQDRLKEIDAAKAENAAPGPVGVEGLSTREKLEKLVRLNLQKKGMPLTGRESLPRGEPIPAPVAAAREPFLVKDFYYAVDGRYGKVRLGDWLSLQAGRLAVIAGSDEFAGVDPARMLFFDSETTGLAGGTGTIPFMLGFGYFSDQAFQVRIFVLLDLDKEGEFLEAVASFLGEGGFSAVVTYNGKAFDFPLLETRYILQRQRFPLRGPAASGLPVPGPHHLAQHLRLAQARLPGRDAAGAFARGRHRRQRHPGPLFQLPAQPGLLADRAGRRAQRHGPGRAGRRRAAGRAATWTIIP